MPWIKFLSGRTCILLWILYGNMVDFSFIVSLYVSNFLNVTTSTKGRTIQYRTVTNLDGTFGYRAEIRAEYHHSFG